MTDATALAPHDDCMTYGCIKPDDMADGKSCEHQGCWRATLLDSLSQRLAAAERERDGYMASAELHYKIRCDQEQNSSNLADQLAAAERRNAELARRAADLEAKLNTPQTSDFIEAVRAEAAHQRERWGEAHDRDKSAENWFWLVGYLAGKALRASIDGDCEKAKHHTISSAAALAEWHAAITQNESARGIGLDVDLASLASQEPPTS